MTSLKTRIGRILNVGFEGFQAPDYILDWLARGQVGGIILFARNVDTPAQLAELTRTLRAAAPEPILISIDQEGGTVARLRQGFTESPGAMALGVSGSEEMAEAVSAVLGAEIHALGIDWDLAPVVDLGHDSSNPVIGTRTLGIDADRVGRLAAAEVRGFQKAGDGACDKHFPGHGNTPTDSHVSLPVVSGSLDYLWQHDLRPFRAAVEAGIASVMVSHVKFEALDPDYPATLSPAIATRLLRDDVGFTGMAATDCMEMKAITKGYGTGESAVLAALAGHDVIFFSHTRALQQEAYDALTAAAESGRLPEARIEQALARQDAFKARFPVSEARPLEVIRQSEHLAVCRRAAEAGMVLIRAEKGIFPLPQDQPVALVEFASPIESGIIDQGGHTGLGAILQTAAPRIQHLALSPTAPQPAAVEQARALAGNAGILIVATRSAHLTPAQRELAQSLLDSATHSILLCLRNPYDVEALHGAGSILCTCGDSIPSLQAAVETLLGRYTPTGHLPVPIKSIG